jgi:hypothetical protein
MSNFILVGNKGMAQADYGYFGPNYSVADNIKLPGDVGVRRESSFSAIFDAVGGINYYLDVIAFGSATGFDTQQQYPMGIRYYLDTGLRCSNGASMSEYFDGVTKGDLLGENVKRGLASAGLPGLQGLAPGMLENARDALDPRPIFSAVSGTGYPVCQKVTCPIGTAVGAVSNATEPGKPFIVGEWQNRNGYPVQTRWVQAFDANGYAISISKDEFTATPKCYNADGSYIKNPPDGCPPTEPADKWTSPSGNRYGLCGLVQPAVMPPTLQEGFIDLEDNTLWLMLGATAILGGIAVWSLTRK